MSNNKIIQFSYFYWNTNDKKVDEKRPYFTMEYAKPPILRDASGKMHHGILFDRRLSTNHAVKIARELIMLDDKPSK